MSSAVKGLSSKPDHVLIDGNRSFFFFITLKPRVE